VTTKIAARQRSVFEGLPKNSKVLQRPSPIGPLTFYASDDALHAILFVCDHVLSPRAYFADFEVVKEPSQHSILNVATRQINEYFAGERKQFDLPLQPMGTPFQLTVWSLLAEIPYGETTGYGDMALKLGDKNKARAVGMANGRNPISIILPCHRVIGSNGSLTGYAGGLDSKSFLLNLEGHRCNERTQIKLPFHSD
jgi:methylated-DNA-[protein]-cysteine S-methyltransferase